MHFEWYHTSYNATNLLAIILRCTEKDERFAKIYVCFWIRGQRTLFGLLGWNSPKVVVRLRERCREPHVLWRSRDECCGTINSDRMYYKTRTTGKVMLPLIILATLRSVHTTLLCTACICVCTYDLNQRMFVGLKLNANPRRSYLPNYNNFAQKWA